MKQYEILDEDLEFNNYKIAGKGARLGNFIIDTIGYFFIVFLHAMVLDGWLGLIPEDGSPFLGFYSFFLYVMYHAIPEHFLKKTPGKYVTNTIVVKEDENQLSFKDILIRNICRLIPFDTISFLISKNGWHDKISKTKVVYGQ
ncbi:RDD family protein [Aureispira anguillae]|uniref:RDD family protein n=1 Tax=Aureispira anguillae TaxID=2864201 RepID=A0A915YHA6_9BACT|nr:RDD family protein [Aureispira anguillae]BDS13012.1 RDD family protein [Aureispira anguillae]